MCFSLLFSCYLKTDITHDDCTIPDTKKFPPVFLKCIFLSEFHSGANPIIILCYSFSFYFLRKRAPFLLEILGFPFPDFSFCTPRLLLLEYTDCSIWSSLLYKRHFYISSVEFWTGFGYSPDFFIIFLLLLQLTLVTLLDPLLQKFSAMDFGWVLWPSSSGGSQSSVQESCRRPLLRSDTLSGSFLFPTNND